MLIATKSEAIRIDIHHIIKASYELRRKSAHLAIEYDNSDESAVLWGLMAEAVWTVIQAAARAEWEGAMLSNGDGR